MPMNYTPSTLNKPAHPHTHQLTVNQLAAMPMHAARVALARDGWVTSIELYRERESLRGVARLQRSDWHGRHISDINFHIEFRLGADICGQRAAREAFQRAAGFALEAWWHHPKEWTVIDQTATALVVCDYSTRNQLGSGGSPVKDWFPKEELPDASAAVGRSFMVGSCPILEARLQLLEIGIPSTDRLTWIGFNPGSYRLPEVRRWGYELDARIGRWHEQRIMSQFHSQSFDGVDGEMALNLVLGFKAGIDRLRDLYPAGGPLPPNMFTLAEMLRQEEMDRREREDEGGREMGDRYRACTLHDRLDRLRNRPELAAAMPGEMERLQAAIAALENRAAGDADTEDDNDPAP